MGSNTSQKHERLLRKLLYPCPTTLPSNTTTDRPPSQTLARLRSAVESARSRLMPKEQFSFKARRQARIAAASPKPDPIETVEGTSTPSDSQQTQPGTAAQTQTSAVPSSGPATGSERAAAAGGGGLTISGVSGTTMEVLAEEHKGGDVTIQNATGCVVRVRGAVTALRVLHFTECTVAADAVDGAVFVDYAEKCRFTLACRQVR